MVVQKLQCLHAIINLTMNKNGYAFKQLEEKSTELKLLLKRQLVLEKKIFMFKDLLEYSLVDWVFHARLETLKQNEWNTVETLM